MVNCNQGRRVEQSMWKKHKRKVISTTRLYKRMEKRYVEVKLSWIMPACILSLEVRFILKEICWTSWSYQLQILECSQTQTLSRVQIPFKLNIHQLRIEINRQMQENPSMVAECQIIKKLCPKKQKQTNLQSSSLLRTKMGHLKRNPYFSNRFHA